LIRSDRANELHAIVKTSWASALVIAIAFAPVSAHAGSGNDVALAESLFQEGKKLMSEGKYAEACPKLAESQRLDPGGGTLLALGLCHEGEGKTATAWAELNEALAAAIKDGNGVREKAARDHIAAIEPKIPHLVVKVPDEDAAIDGFVITLDDAPLAKAAWGSPIPVDPGKHTLHAKAPGKSEWSTTTDAVAATQVQVDVSVLGDAVATTGVDAAPTSSDSKRTIGFVVGGVSLVALGVGGYFGLRAISKRHQSNDLCPADDQCTPDGKSLNDEAKSAATVSTILVGVGIAGAAVATWMILTSSSASASPSDAKSTSASSFRVTPIVGPSGGAITFGGAF
jgi:hypothetical protein